MSAATTTARPSRLPVRNVMYRSLDPAAGVAAELLNDRLRGIALKLRRRPIPGILGKNSSPKGRRDDRARRGGNSGRRGTVALTLTPVAAADHEQVVRVSDAVAGLPASSPSIRRLAARLRAGCGCAPMPARRQRSTMSAAVARDDLQERGCRPAAGRRQGGDHRRSARATRRRSCWRVWQRGRNARGPLLDGGGHGDDPRRHGRDRRARPAM